MSDVVRLFKAARVPSTPLFHIKTPDQAATLAMLKTKALVNGTTAPLLVWDCVRGIQPGNDLGLEICWRIILNRQQQPLPTDATQQQNMVRELSKATFQPSVALQFAQVLPGAQGDTDGSVLVMLNAHLVWDKPEVKQAIWNLRDQFKADQRALVMLTGPGAMLPKELQDALPLTEEPPTLDELGAIVDEQTTAVGVEIAAPEKTKAVDALCGLPNAFVAEQTVGMSFVRKGDSLSLDPELLWSRTCEAINSVQGLKVKRPNQGFAYVGGHENLKEYLRSVIRGKLAPRVVVLWDEIQDAMAGAEAEGDSSGTSQEMHGTVLKEMQKREYDGIILVGPPGTGKSWISEAAAAEAGRPFIEFDFTAAKSKYVGSSNENLVQMFAIIHAISQGQALWIGTCNSVAKLSPQLKRRFTRGTFFVDMPSGKEHEQLWSIYLKKYGLTAKPADLPEHGNWTGADVKACCRRSWEFGIPLKKAATYLTPVAVTDAAAIHKLRTESSGQYISSSYEGYYRYETGTRQLTAAPTGRAVRMK